MMRRVEHVHVNEGGQAIIGTGQGTSRRFLSLIGRVLTLHPTTTPCLGRARC